MLNWEPAKLKNDVIILYVFRCMHAVSGCGYGHGCVQGQLLGVDFLFLPFFEAGSLLVFPLCCVFQASWLSNFWDSLLSLSLMQP